MAIAQRRGRPGPDPAQRGRAQDAPAAGTAWLALPDRGLAIGDELLRLIADEINVKEVELIDDESDARRAAGQAAPAEDRASGSGRRSPRSWRPPAPARSTFEADGSVTLAGVTLAPDEVEIQATPRPGTAVADDEGLVVVIDTELTPELRAEGDARELAAGRPGPAQRGRPRARRPDRAVDRRAVPTRSQPHLPTVAADTLADARRRRRRPPTPRGRPSSSTAARSRSPCAAARVGASRRRSTSDGGRPSVDAAPVGRRDATGRGAHWIVVLRPRRDRRRPRPARRRRGCVGQRVAGRDRCSVIGDLVRLVFSQNNGALFGLFRDHALLFGLVSLGVIGLIVVYHGAAGRSLYLSVALGLLLGGALGNLIDRLRLGYVVDFVDIGIGDFRWYTFNVADAAISLAIVMLIGGGAHPGAGRTRSSDGRMADPAYAPGVRVLRVPDGSGGRVDRFVADATGPVAELRPEAHLRRPPDRRPARPLRANAIVGAGTDLRLDVPEPAPLDLEPAPEIALSSRLRGRRPADRRQAGRPGRPPVAGPRRRHARQRAARRTATARPRAGSPASSGRASSIASTATRAAC